MPNPYYPNNGYQQQPMPQMQEQRAALMPYGQVVGAWVNGPEMAQGMFLEPNKIAFMVDEEHNKIYVKRADQIGRQSQVEEYDHVIPPQPEVNLTGYVKTSDFNEFTARFDSLEDKINGLFDSLSAPKRRARREETENDE